MLSTKRKPRRVEIEWSFVCLQDRDGKRLLTQANTCSIKREHLFFCTSFIQRYETDIAMD